MKKYYGSICESGATCLSDGVATDYGIPALITTLRKGKAMIKDREQ